MSLATKALLAAAALVQLTGAIDLNDPLDGCPPAARAIADSQSVFNSTGETPFKLQQNQANDWYLSLTFRDERKSNVIYGVEQTRQTLGVIVSVPGDFPRSDAGKQTNLCIYRLQQQNGTANEQASCSGLLSEECIKALNNVPAAKDGSCPVPDIGGACGDATISGSTLKPLNFNNTLCATNATIPDSNAVPDGYENYITFASGELNETDSSKKSYTLYDEHILRPAPILITGQVGGQSNSSSSSTQSKLFCLAPSKVIKGSRNAVVGAGGATAATMLSTAKPVLLVSVLSSMMLAAL
ncbi:hypothetical protein NLG97_g3712 [Lecanicillium saksenae]|uniref:Uncharacterized protein n=1 Tax=Lecanicillium saksenae TaxID=468837 RepID=A0ACC1QYP7_9HYPO|nr:hypothetical protein NLG97_g3712 [Lecanicillium saksenae]